MLVKEMNKTSNSEDIGISAQEYCDYNISHLHLNLNYRKVCDMIPAQVHLWRMFPLKMREVRLSSVAVAGLVHG